LSLSVGPGHTFDQSIVSELIATNERRLSLIMAKRGPKPKFSQGTKRNRRREQKRLCEQRRKHLAQEKEAEAEAAAHQEAEEGELAQALGVEVLFDSPEDVEDGDRLVLEDLRRLESQADLNIPEGRAVPYEVEDMIRQRSQRTQGTPPLPIVRIFHWADLKKIKTHRVYIRIGGASRPFQRIQGTRKIFMEIGNSLEGVNSLTSSRLVKNGGLVNKLRS
jgi:hypothetical protein